eukprot:m.372160 g.372160  ORF g.372160 m.372160 type:complete len:55 (+) comp20869_c0_seq36:772-936(+)
MPPSTTNGAGKANGTSTAVPRQNTQHTAAQNRHNTASRAMHQMVRERQAMQQPH